MVANGALTAAEPTNAEERVKRARVKQRGDFVRASKADHGNVEGREGENVMQATLENIVDSASIVASDIGRDQDYLKIIADILQRQEASRQAELEAIFLLKKRQERPADNNLGSSYIVVSVFVASLGVALLSYARDTFSSRPQGTPSKRTDQVVYALWLISILWSLIGTTILGLVSNSGIIQIIVASRNSDFNGIRNLLKRPTSHNHNHGARTKMHSLDAYEAASIIGSDAESKHSVETTGLDAVISKESLLTLAISNMGLAFVSPALVLMIIGLMVFVWAELEHSVAIALTASWLLLFLQLLLGGLFVYSLRSGF